MVILARIVATTLLAVGAIACGGSDVDDEASDAGPAAAAAVEQPDTSAPSCDGASLEQRAALALVVGLPGVTGADDPLVDELVATGVGGVMLRDENLVELGQGQALVRGLRERLGPDLLVAIDEEGGRVSSLRALGDKTPSARRLGQAGADAAAQAGSALGERLRSLGVDWIFAPVLDLDGGPATGVIGDRSYGVDPAAVTEAAAAFAGELRRAGVAVTLKHYPGHGGNGDPHLEVSVDDSTREELTGADLVPFQALIESGAEAVMVGHVAYPRVWTDLPASLEPGAYELLRSVGFDGIAITDALGMGTITTRWGFDVAPSMALAAGADAALVNQGGSFRVLVDGIVAAVDRGDLSEARLNEAVTRVLDLHGRQGTVQICS